MSENLTPDIDSINDRFRSIEDALIMIKERNARVEADKLWETSLARRLVVSILIYLITTSVFWSLSVSSPFLSALIPLCGYFISTLTIPWARKIWLSGASTASDENSSN